MSNDNSEDENIKIRDFRLENFKAILKEQFQLAYHGRIDYDASESMTILERHTMYKILIEQKQEEQKAREEALKAAEARKKSGSWHRKR